MERVLLDENIRGLTRWLRFLGFDTLVAQGEGDSMLLARASAEHRVFFTRDRELARRGAVLVPGNTTPAQLTATLSRLGWPPEREWFSRCTLCNCPLRELPEVAGEPYRRCDECGRVYWRGSHFERARAFLRGIRASA